MTNLIKINDTLLYPLTAVHAWPTFSTSDQKVGKFDKTETISAVVVSVVNCFMCVCVCVSVWCIVLYVCVWRSILYIYIYIYIYTQIPLYIYLCFY